MKRRHIQATCLVYGNISKSNINFIFKTIISEPQPLHICVGKACGLKSTLPQTRAVREAYGTGCALFYLKQ